MRGVLLYEKPAWSERTWLGMPIAMRAAIALIEAGATSIELVGSASLPAWTRDARLTLPVQMYAARGSGTALVLRSDALFSPALLRELALGSAVTDVEGVRLGGLCEVSESNPPQESLQRCHAHAFVPDRYRFAIALRDARSLHAGARALLGALVKPSDGPVSRHFNRHLSRAVTRMVVPLGMTPNQMTVVVALCGIAGAWLASSALASSQLYGALLFQLHSVLDGSDGEIARLTKRYGKHGALIDSVVDDVCNGLFFLGLSIGVARAHDATWPVITAAFTMLTHVPVVLLQLKVVLQQTGRGDKTKFWRELSEPFSLFSLARTVTRRDTFVLLILLGVAAGFAPMAVALFPVASSGALVASLQRMRRLRTASEH